MIGHRLGVTNTTQALQSHFRAELLPIRNLRGHEMTSALERLARKSYRLLLIDLPHRAVLELDRRPSRILERLEKCVRAQQGAQGDTLLLAPWHDAVWSSPAVRRIMQQLLQHQSRVNWCRFQLRPPGESQALSDRSDKTLSSFRMPALDCHCKQPRATHRHDWRITDDDPEQTELRKLRDKQHIAFLQALCYTIKGALGLVSAQGRDSVSESNSKAAFPTEARMRAKLREKKEQGNSHASSHSS